MNDMTVKPIPDDMHGMIPHLICSDASAAIDFYRRAFGAVEVSRTGPPNGKLMHAMLRIGGSPLMLMDEDPQCGAFGPTSLKGSPVGIHFYVEDVDAAFERAIEQGATAKVPPVDMFWGDRFSALTDPFGHTWSIASRIADLTPQEVQAAAVSFRGAQAARQPE